jgi:hypothetical protein
MKSEPESRFEKGIDVKVLYYCFYFDKNVWIYSWKLSDIWPGLWCLTPLSTIFLLNRCGQFEKNKMTEHKLTVRISSTTSNYEMVKSIEHFTGNVLLYIKVW